jgi:hypothetical protein
MRTYWVRLPPVRWEAEGMVGAPAAVCGHVGRLGTYASHSRVRRVRATLTHKPAAPSPPVSRSRTRGRPPERRCAKGVGHDVRFAVHIPVLLRTCVCACVCLAGPPAAADVRACAQFLLTHVGRLCRVATLAPSVVRACPPPPLRFPVPRTPSPSPPPQAFARLLHPRTPRPSTPHPRAQLWRRIAQRCSCLRLPTAAFACCSRPLLQTRQPSAFSPACAWGLSPLSPPPNIS